MIFANHRPTDDEKGNFLAKISTRKLCRSMKLLSNNLEASVSRKELIDICEKLNYLGCRDSIAK